MFAHFNPVAILTTLLLASPVAFTIADSGFVSVGSEPVTLSDTPIRQKVSNVPSAAYIVGQVDGTSQDLVFAVNIESTSNDLYFHMSGPASQAWVGVGTGTLMSGALMFIAYPAADGKSKNIRKQIVNVLDADG